MAVKTHPNFKTVVPSVSDADTIDDVVGRALSYQYMFERRTTPWEMQEWDYDELQKFEVDAEKVDRLYDIHGTRHSGGASYDLTARMDYDGIHLYVELSASCDYTGFECQGGGTIFVSKDANLFMKLVLSSDYKKDLIYKSLTEDGIHMEEVEGEEYNPYLGMFRKTPPMLMYLCHEAVYEKKDILKGYASVLPKILTDSLDDFIKTKEARIAYDDF